MFRFWRQWPCFQKGCASRSSWLEAVVIPVWVLVSDHGFWYSTGFDVWYQIYLFVATWCCMGGWCSCWYSIMVRSMAQRQCSDCDVQLCHDTHVVALPLCTLPIVVLGPSSLGGSTWAEASSSLLPSSRFPSAAQVRDSHLSHIHILCCTGWLRKVILSIILRKTFYTRPPTQLMQPLI